VTWRREFGGLHSVGYERRRRRVGDPGVSWAVDVVDAMSRENAKVARGKDTRSGGDKDG
jgi:hypothetical protein